MTNPASEAQNDTLRVDFDRRAMMELRGSVVTSDAGLLAYRELDDALRLSRTAGEALADARTGKNGRHALVGLLRQSEFGRLAGYEDVNDAERLRHDPAMRWIVGGKAAKGRAASPSQMGRFETQARGNWKLLGTGRPLRPLDRSGSRTPVNPGDRAGYGFERESDPWRIKAERLERALRLHVLSSAFPLQPAWGSGTIRASSWKCSQRRQLGGRAQTDCCALPGQGRTHLFASRRRLRHAECVRVPGSQGNRVCDPPAGQSGLARADRPSAQTASRPTAA